MEKQIVINADIFILFKTLLDDMIQNAGGKTRKILTELRIGLQSDSSLRDSLDEVSYLENSKNSDPIVIAVCYFFIARSFSKRSDFIISLELLERAEMLLMESQPDLAELLKKEIYVLKMAYHYSEN
ncbi:MAG TPA: hypothetical protein DHW82_13440 [Spirochaetia bacterium]|nr:hypothetical protein [Spirochaetia bacterium]